MRRRHPRARWLAPEMLHLTLVFLGATDPARVNSITDAVASLATGQGAIDVSTGPAGGRADDRRGGVAWLGLDGGRDALARLSVALDRAIGSGTYGGGASPRPHLTVARRVDEALLDDLRQAPGRWRLEWQVDALVLFRSHTGPDGPHYEELDRRLLTPPRRSA